MAQYIDKAAVVEEIDALQDTTMENGHFLSSYHEGIFDGLSKIENFLDTLETKEVEKESVSNDLEEFAKRESELFAEREYEIDYIDRNALAKGYYWGIKSGVQWQKEQMIKEVDLKKELKTLDNTLFDLDGVAVQGATHYLTVEDVKDIAKHFYELGLAQKRE